MQLIVTAKKKKGQAAKIFFSNNLHSLLVDYITLCADAALAGLILPSSATTVPPYQLTSPLLHQSYPGNISVWQATSPTWSVHWRHAGWLDTSSPVSRHPLEKLPYYSLSGPLWASEKRRFHRQVICYLEGGRFTIKGDPSAGKGL